MFETLYNVFLATLALGMCLYMILPLVRRAPKKQIPGKVYDFRPLEEKVEERIRLTRASDTERRHKKTQLGIDRKVWDQKFDQFLKQDDPEKKHPTPKVDRAPKLTHCDPPHIRSEVCHECDEYETFQNWQGTQVYRRRKNG